MIGHTQKDKCVCFRVIIGLTLRCSAKSTQREWGFFLPVLRKCCSFQIPLKCWHHLAGICGGEAKQSSGELDKYGAKACVRLSQLSITVFKEVMLAYIRPLLPFKDTSKV